MSGVRDLTDIPAVGAHVQVRREAGNAFQSAIVVGHLSDPVLGTVLKLRMSDAERIERVWPSSEIRR